MSSLEENHDVGSGPVEAARSRRKALRWPALVGVVLVVAAAWFLVHSLASEWSQVREEVANAEWVWFVPAFAFGLAGMAWAAYTWRRALRILGASSSRRETVAWFFTGELGKYVPGGVWTFVGRGEIARRRGVPRMRSYPSVALSLAGLYLGAMLLAVVIVPFDLSHQSSHPAALALLLLLPLGLGLLHPRVVRFARDKLARVTKRQVDMPIPTWGQSIMLVACYVPAWILIWASTWATARAFIPHPDVLRIGIATLLSWIAGFLAVPVPSGAGVREAVFTAASGLPAGLGATIAIASRVVFLLVDVGAAALTAPWHRSRGPVHLAPIAEPAGGPAADVEPSGPTVQEPTILSGQPDER